MMTATPGPEVEFSGGRMAIHFARFDMPSYDVFLRAKRLPEFEVVYHDDETYSIKAPARFAAMLGIERPRDVIAELPLASHLFDDQAAIVRLALEAKRFACWSDCGLGKTPIGLEVARQIINLTGGRVLITTFNEVVGQWIDEAKRFYGDSLPLDRLGSKAEMKVWCASPGPGLGITNYEKWNPEGKVQVISEVKQLAGVILDESSRLKTGGGKQKWAIIKSCKAVEYKLSLTATPAPNDVMEFASQASFLETMRSEGEILWTYFQRHPKTHRWAVRPHARAAFFEFMAGWSIYVRHPKRYGWRAGMAEPPAPETIVHEIAITPEQSAELARLTTDPKTGQMGMFDNQESNAIQRGRLSQIAKGFRYRKQGKGRRVERISSLKPGKVAEIVATDVADGLQVLVWTLFDAESDILADEIAGLSLKADLLTGKTSDDDRLLILDRFRKGETPALISRASMLGYGMNFQCCGSMVFSGFNDSYESYYQAVRRAVRHGQTRSVRVHLPLIPELEGDMLENLFRKQADHEAAIAEMEANYIKASRHLKGA